MAQEEFRLFSSRDFLEQGNGLTRPQQSVVHTVSEDPMEVEDISFGTYHGSQMQNGHRYVRRSRSWNNQSLPHYRRQGPDLLRWHPYLRRAQTPENLEENLRNYQRDLQSHTTQRQRRLLQRETSTDLNLLEEHRRWNCRSSEEGQQQSVFSETVTDSDLESGRDPDSGSHFNANCDESCSLGCDSDTDSGPDPSTICNWNNSRNCDIESDGYYDCDSTCAFSSTTDSIFNSNSECNPLSASASGSSTVDYDRDLDFGSHCSTNCDECCRSDFHLDLDSGSDSSTIYNSNSISNCGTESDFGSVSDCYCDSDSTCGCSSNTDSISNSNSECNPLSASGSGSPMMDSEGESNSHSDWDFQRFSYDYVTDSRTDTESDVTPNTEEIIAENTAVYKYKKSNMNNGDGKTNTESCVICMTDFEEDDDIRRLRCLHVFHKDCIDRWFSTKTRCAICRTAAADGLEDCTDDENSASDEEEPTDDEYIMVDEDELAFEENIVINIVHPVIISTERPEFREAIVIRTEDRLEESVDVENSENDEVEPTDDEYIMMNDH